SDDPSQKTVAAQVTMCNTAYSGDDQYLWSPLSWELRDDLGSSYQVYGYSGAYQPQLLYSDRVPPIGECVKGWILWDVPKTDIPTKIVFRPEEQDLATWSLP